MSTSYAATAEPVGFTVGESTLGAVLVAATSRGICAVLLADRPDALEQELRRSYPEAVAEPGDPTLTALQARVVCLLDGGRGAGLPLDPHGSDFERTIWRAIGEIPAGSRLSYTALAAAVGMPRSVRAVAGACSANRVAVAIPCHRVVRADGALGGYRWGLERKRRLLEREERG
jgi:AraC family transcriptional regulator, regulatory protein of adaptative response / methylated-DNA-[protein]-cysteine methyltransferase